MVGIAAVAMAYVLSQFFRSFMAVLTPGLVAEIGITTAELSLASGAWFAAFALMQFAVGVALDRYGPKWTTAVMFGLFGGGGAFLFAGASAPWMIIAGMGLIGAGCAPVLMAGMFIFARSFPPARLAIMTSWFIAFGSAGNVFGTTPLATAADMFGWRGVLVGIGCLALLVALCVLIFVRDPESALAASGKGRGLSGYLEVLKIRKLWLIVPLIGLNYAPTIGILGLWSGPYLTQMHGADALAIGQVTFFMAMAVIAGSFLYGPLDTLFGTRKWVAVAGNAGSVVVLAWLALFPAPTVGAVTLAFFLIALFGSSFGVIMAHARAFLPVHLTGRGMTLLNFFSIGTVGLMQFASGAVVTVTESAQGPAIAYGALFAFYGVTVSLALLAYLFSQDAKPGAMPGEQANLPPKPAGSA